MSKISNREEFKAYIFRRLGYPVIQVNVSNEQADDRIDDALAFYGDYYPLGSEKSLYVHTITQEDVDNKAITLPDTITSVSGMLPREDYGGGNFMSDRYQFLRNEFFGFINNISYSIIPYFVGMTRIADLDFLFNVQPSYRFNLHKNQIEFPGSALGLLVVGNKIVFEVQAIIDPDVYSDVWNDRWLKKYATALMKRQWAENLKLYSGVQLIGGISLDAQSMYQEAMDEITTMEEKIISSGSYPVLDEIA